MYCILSSTITVVKGTLRHTLNTCYSTMAQYSLVSVLLFLCLTSWISAFMLPGVATRSTVARSFMADEESSSGAANEGPSEGMKELLETPEMMQFLQSDKMQEAMQLVMAGKQEELQERVQNDREFQEIVEKLNEILSGQENVGMDNSGSF